MDKIKRIIFDLDNTLIPWNNDFLEAVKQAVLEYSISCSYEKMDEAYASYEDFYCSYTISNFKEHIKNQLGLEVSEEFIKAWIKYLGKMAKVNPEINETLAYLKEKYDLAVLTNGFKKSQIERLETAQIRTYFSDIYGGEEYIKPDKRCFIEACGPYLPEECLMVGDNYVADIKGAMNAGLKAIHLNKKEEIPGVRRVRSISELKEIL